MHPPILPMLIYSDSSGGESMANFNRVRNLRVQYHWLRDAVKSKELAIEHIPGKDDPADIFTEPLTGPDLKKNVGGIGSRHLGGGFETDVSSRRCTRKHFE
ncbi:hypothetical protein OE88DRAFT_1347166 [Heliocybe sulcata]|uniref:Copia protein n=1 Tax=Heliocybe sulcata TaxID=5364 RepID=A0A5C3N6X2_9AGAM|nr:hypothetical protein OE88DRAFT_1347166 [Heliocybe sulcata]